MRILVTGAKGLIGSAVCARLATDGHDVIATTRGPLPDHAGAATRWVQIDFAEATDPASWHAHLEQIDAVVNCVGVFQDSPRESTSAAHLQGASALFRACADRGVRRVIHFSAIGVDRHQSSAFSATKAEGERALMALDLDWIILRPSVVLGQPIFGASAMFRGLAALPVVPVMQGTGPLQVVALEDVIDTVSSLVRPNAPARIALDLAGPERLQMANIVARYRQWLGWKPARQFIVPNPLGGMLYRLGDLAGALGWRPPLRSTARAEMVHGAIGDPEPWAEIMDKAPADLSSSLARHPATVQDRWFAKLYFLKPLIVVVLAAFWIMTGIISLSTGFHKGVDLMIRAGTGILAAPGVVAGALADIVIGIAIIWRPTAWLGLCAGIGLSLFYITVGTALLPELWREPLGPLLKIWPILTAHFVALAILDER